MDPTAPEITAVSYPNSNPPKVATSVSPITKVLPLPLDFVKSVMFYEGDSESRLNKNALGKISQAMTGNLYIDECECIRELPFLESQQIPLNHAINPYSLQPEDLGEYTDVSLDDGIIIANSLQDDQLTAIQFTPQFDGILEFMRIPIKIVKTGTIFSIDDVPLDFDIYLSGDTAPGVDLSTPDGNLITDAPVSSLIKNHLTS